MKRFVFLTPVIMTIFPMVAGAQANGVCDYEIVSVAQIFHLFGCILASAVIPMLVTLAVVVFIIGVIKYVINANDSTKRLEGRNFMIYGIVALFVIVSIWGLVGVIQGTFGLGTNVLIPQLQGI